MMHSEEEVKSFWVKVNACVSASTMFPSQSVYFDASRYSKHFAPSMEFEVLFRSLHENLSKKELFREEQSSLVVDKFYRKPSHYAPTFIRFH